MNKHLLFKKKIMASFEKAVDNCLEQGYLNELDLARSNPNFNGASLEAADFKGVIELVIPINGLDNESRENSIADIHGNRVMRIAARISGDNPIKLADNK